ncbi:MAG: hypothetical protein NZL91_03115 [Thermoflexales bacterium]|nr:hypothetical protein [Thermoflexales bacterium]MDW8292977.1 hypothetical protein [Anaerolineae bacterium]
MTSLTLSAAPLLVVLPLAAGALTFLVRRWSWAEGAIAAVACALVASLLAAPTAATVHLGVITLSLDAPFVVLGRTLQIDASNRLALAGLFSGAVFLFALSSALPRQGDFFYPLALGMLGTLAAGLVVRPLLFAALAIEVAAALGALLIQANRLGARSTQGAARYLVSGTLAMPTFFLAFWLADRAPTLEGEAATLPVVLLVLGSGLLFGAIPLYSWLHAAAQESPPMVVAAIGAIALGFSQAWLLRLWSVLDWLRASALAQEVLLVGAQAIWVGVALIAWAQRSWSRVLACVLFLEVANALWSVATSGATPLAATVFGIAARSLMLSALGLGLSYLRPVRRADGTIGYACSSLLLVLTSVMALAGLPGTVGFVERWLLVRAIESSVEPIGLMALAGVSLFAGALRNALPLLRCAENAEQAQHDAHIMRLAVAAALVLLIGLGLWPSLLSLGAAAP